MVTNQFFVGLFEFFLNAAACAIVIAATYRLFVRAHSGFDMGAEIRNGNVAVGILASAVLISAAHIVMAATDSSASIFRMHLLAPAQENVSRFKIMALIAAHLSIAMALAVISISVALRFLGRLDKKLNVRVELQNGNLAVGLVLSAVVLISSIYVKDGISSLSKALRPHHSIGRVQISK